MEPEEFVQRWQEQLAREGTTLESDPLVRLPQPDGRLTSVTERFLTHSGLPASTSPFIGFGNLGSGLKRIYEVYGPHEDWWHGQETRLQPFLIIGTDDGGSPICVDTFRQDMVVVLDHENSFQSSQFMNSSVPQLAASLLAFRGLLSSFWEEFGEETELFEGNVPKRLADQFMQQLRDIDAEAAKEGNFWPGSVLDL